MKSLGLSVLVVFGLMCSSAFADEIYQLSVSENGCTTDCIPINTFDVDVSLVNSTTATVTFTQENADYVLFNALISVNLPGGSTLGVTSEQYTPVGGTQTTNSPITSNTECNDPPVSLACSNNGTPSIDSYGNMTFSFSPPGHDATSVVLSIQLDGGTGTWSSAADVLALETGQNKGDYPGVSGFYAASQISYLDCASGDPGCNGRTGTGTGDNGQLGSAGDSAADVGTASTPEPTSVILLGSIMLLVTVGFRRRLAR